MIFQAVSRAEEEAVRSNAPLPDNGFFSASLDKDLSFCIIERERVMAYTAAEHMEDGIVNISAFHSGFEDRRIIMKSSLSRGPADNSHEKK